MRQPRLTAAAASPSQRGHGAKRSLSLAVPEVVRGVLSFSLSLCARPERRGDRERRLGMSSTETQDRTPGSLAAAVSRHVVRLFAEYTGRGPTRARTTIR